MIYKEYGKTGKKLSAIGFGGMRLPNPRAPRQAIEMLHLARLAGINYFDTAPAYCEDLSESIFGEAFRSMPDTGYPFYVSSKCSAEKASDFRRGLERSLARLGLAKIDFFHVWCVMDPEDWQRRIRGGALGEILRAKEEGLVDHVCVSTHMRGQEIAAMVEAHPEIDGLTIGYSAINFPYRRAGVEAANGQGMGLVAMNPLGGGLIPSRPEAFDFIRAPDDADVVAAALRFLVSDPAITCALVGFGSAAHVREAVGALDSFHPHSTEHLGQIRARIELDFNEICTGCGYCLPCPHAVPIPQLMDVYNLMLLKVDTGSIDFRYKYHWGIGPEDALRCVRCGLCESRCTQHLLIADRLDAIVRTAR